MKRLTIILLLFLSASFVLQAIPAFPGIISYVQPDGTVIQLVQHGDEWGHWTTDMQGNMLSMDEDGYYKVDESLDVEAVAYAARLRRGVMRQEQAQARANGRFNAATGKKHYLVILVAFQDKAFTGTDPNTAFTNMLNQHGYSLNGATGSARDYYYDNSHGKFEPVFDVYGPVTVSNNLSYYGANDSYGYDKRAEIAVLEGITLLKDQIDFTKYDANNDGKVDLVFMYYAGYGEADGGGANTIWPHKWELSSAGLSFSDDGKSVDDYACANELAATGALKNKMDGIGCVCHEFGHAMGLPDLYDTDYDYYNDEAGGLYDYSLMAAGSYNNESRTPPCFTMEERVFLGWVTAAKAYQTIDKSGSYSCTTVLNQLAYKTLTDKDGEYFAYECRSQVGWDKYIPAPGLIVYHVDKSSRLVEIFSRHTGQNISVPAAELWNNWEAYNSINENGSHPCYYIVPAGAQSDLNFSGSASKFPFPYNDVDYYTPRSWNGVDGNVTLQNITFSSNQVTFQAVVKGDQPAMEWNYIDNPGKGVYQAGTKFMLNLVSSSKRKPQSTHWYYDGVSVSGNSVTLQAGVHVVEAEVTLSGGKTDRITLEITAQ